MSIQQKETLEALVDAVITTKFGPVPVGSMLGTLEKIRLKKMNAGRQKIRVELKVIDRHLHRLGEEDSFVSLITKKLWLAVRSGFNLPSDNDYSSGELYSSAGTVGTVVAGVVKSIRHQRPMIEIHGTVCPSYPDEGDWREMEPTGVYIYQEVNEPKVRKVADFINILLHYGSDAIGDTVLHTPAPKDRGSSFSESFGIFREGNMKQGVDSLKLHWQQMEGIVSRLPAVALAPDLAFIDQHITRKETDQLLAENLVISQAYRAFIESDYTQRAYAYWGCDLQAVFGGLYLGTVIAYGNREENLQMDSDAPLKLNLNFEEGDSPKTFAGKRIGVDFRHLLAGQGHHLALMAADPVLQSPWAIKRNRGNP